MQIKKIADFEAKNKDLVNEIQQKQALITKYEAIIKDITEKAKKTIIRLSSVDEENNKKILNISLSNRINDLSKLSDDEKKALQNMILNKIAQSNNDGSYTVFDQNKKAVGTLTDTTPIKSFDNGIEFNIKFTKHEDGIENDDFFDNLIDDVISLIKAN